MDIKSGAILFEIIYPEIAILIAGMLILLLGNLIKSRGAMAFLALVGLVVGLIFAVRQWGDPQSGFFGMVMVDNFSVFFNVIFVAAAALTIMMARSYLKAHDIDRFEFYPLILFSTVGMMVMASSADLVVIFLGLEIMSVPLYVMAGFARRDPGSNEASILSLIHI